MTLLAGGLVTSCDSKATNTPPEKAEVKEAENTPPEKAKVKEVSPATKKLIEAIKVGECWKYEDCIKEGADVNANFDEGKTLLFKELESALERGKYDGAKILIKNGADINHIFSTTDGARPLWEIIISEAYPPHRDELEAFYDWLIKNDIELKPGGWQKNTLMHIAAGRGFRGLLNTLRIRGAETNCLNAEGKTPLDFNVDEICNAMFIAKVVPIHLAGGRHVTKSRHWEVTESLFLTLEALLNSGANPNIWHEEGLPNEKIQVNAITRIMRNFDFSDELYGIFLKEVYKYREPYHRDKNGLNLLENYLMSNVSDKTISGNKITTDYKDRFFLGLFISDGVRISDPKALELLKKDEELYNQYQKEQGIK